MACFHSNGILPSASDLFIRIVKGLARALHPSLSRRAGILVSPVDLDVLIFISWSQTKVSSIVESLNVEIGLVFEHITRETGDCVLFLIFITAS